MPEQVCIVVVPRDRFSSVIDCTDSIIANTNVPFRLVFVDLGYSQRTLNRLRERCAGIPMEVVTLGRTIPMYSRARRA
jgi:hypothetical protein